MRTISTLCTPKSKKLIPFPEEGMHQRIPITKVLGPLPVKGHEISDCFRVGAGFFHEIKRISELCFFDIPDQTALRAGGGEVIKRWKLFPDLFGFASYLKLVLDEM